MGGVLLIGGILSVNVRGTPFEMQRLRNVTSSVDVSREVPQASIAAIHACLCCDGLCHVGSSVCFAAWGVRRQSCFLLFGGLFFGLLKQVAVVWVSWRSSVCLWYSQR